MPPFLIHCKPDYDNFGNEYSVIRLNVMELSNYLKIYPSGESPDHFLVFSARNASKVLLHRDTLKAAREGALDPEDENTLAELGFLVQSAQDEKREMLDIMEEINGKAQIFSATVVLNLDCNLACGYCYEGTMKGRRYMSEEIAGLLCDFVEKKHIASGLSVHLDFYGGEPLLSVRMIKNISERLRSAAERRGLRYGFSLITNGTLFTGKTARELIPLGLEGAKMTLDGPAKIHDGSRPFKGGGGSYAVILKNIAETCKMTNVQIGGNFTLENYREFPELLDELIAAGISPDRLQTVKFTPVSGTKGEFALPDFNDGCTSINEPWIAESGLFLREEILKRGFATTATLPSFCMVESRNDIVVNYDGILYKCPGFLGWKEMSIGDLQRGDGDYRASHNLDVWKKKECLDCAYLPLCFGGCRFMKLLRDGNIDDADCRKEYLDATLESLVRQDIRYGLKVEDH